MLVCSYSSNIVMLHEHQSNRVLKEIPLKFPLKCKASDHLFAVTSVATGVPLYTRDGDWVQTVHDSAGAQDVAFHPWKSVLALGSLDGWVKFKDWTVKPQRKCAKIKKHIGAITSIHFAPDGRLLMSSVDGNASIVSLNDNLEAVSAVILVGHTARVNHVMLLSNDRCATCSHDKSIRVWDCETGATLHTLTEHTDKVDILAQHPTDTVFASGSSDHSAILWSSNTFEVLHRIVFSKWVQSLLFLGPDTLYVGVYDSGVLSCNTLTGQLNSAVLPGRGLFLGLAQCISVPVDVFFFSFKPTCSFASVPARAPWTASKHLVWLPSSQQNVHLLVAVLWKMAARVPSMRLPYEVVLTLSRNAK